ncbi:hypothetical protein PCC7418_2793 [Halothece sp. PCC 7418]|nr:hypothetical protein PCC7418_2793 [Halothece sp. PCC 7418]
MLKRTPIGKIKSLINQNSKRAKYKEQQRKKKEYLTHSINSDSQSATKIFGIGLSRTATRSLSVALNMLGYRSSHWVYGGNILSLDDFYYFDASTDTCVSYMFETLYHLFPNSKFIYTTRDESNWVNSVSKHFQCETPKDLKSKYIDNFKANRNKYPNQYEFNLHYMAIHDGLYGKFDTWSEAYRAHDQRVNAFFQDHQEKLLVMDITKGDGWNLLCNFLGKEIPGKAFPIRK